MHHKIVVNIRRGKTFLFFRYSLTLMNDPPFSFTFSREKKNEIRTPTDVKTVKCSCPSERGSCRFRYVPGMTFPTWDFVTEQGTWACRERRGFAQFKNDDVGTWKVQSQGWAMIYLLLLRETLNSCYSESLARPQRNYSPSGTLLIIVYPSKSILYCYFALNLFCGR